MRWCRFQWAQNQPAYGLVEGDQVVAVEGTPFGEHRRTFEVHPLPDVRLLVPVVPPVFYAAGVNYREHITEMAKIGAVDPTFPSAADVGYRANNALIADGERIIIPHDATDLVQYEGELVVVFGRTWTTCWATRSATT